MRKAAKSGEYVPPSPGEALTDEEQGVAEEAPRSAARRSSGKPGTLKTRRRRGKYNAVRSEYKGMKFDSKVELARYKQLEEQQARGEIHDLQRQVRFPLYAIVLYDDEYPYDLPDYESLPSPERNAEKIGDYIADHTYYRGEDLVVEDVKGGPVTDLFRWKAKMFRTCYGFDIKIVRMKAA